MSTDGTIRVPVFDEDEGTVVEFREVPLVLGEPRTEDVPDEESDAAHAARIEADLLPEPDWVVTVNDTADPNWQPKGVDQEAFAGDLVEGKADRLPTVGEALANPINAARREAQQRLQDRAAEILMEGLCPAPTKLRLIPVGPERRSPYGDRTEWWKEALSRIPDVELREVDLAQLEGKTIEEVQEMTAAHARQLAGWPHDVSYMPEGWPVRDDTEEERLMELRESLSRASWNSFKEGLLVGAAFAFGVAFVWAAGDRAWLRWRALLGS